MLRANKRPLVYLISSGTLTDQNFPEQSAHFLELVSAAVAAKVSLIQIREKQLSAINVFLLACRAAEITRDSETLTLVNDRADIALAAKTDGVHLTAKSLSAKTVRQYFPPNFVVGASCHSLADVKIAVNGGADFATFSPIFATPSKAKYDLPPQGVDKLCEVCQAAAGFPLIALGGIDKTNFRAVLATGASGIAAIRLLNDAEGLSNIVKSIRNE